MFVIENEFTKSAKENETSSEKVFSQETHSKEEAIEFVASIFRANTGLDVYSVGVFTLQLSAGLEKGEKGFSMSFIDIDPSKGDFAGTEHAEQVRNKIDLLKKYLENTQETEPPFCFLKRYSRLTLVLHVSMATENATMLFGFGTKAGESSAELSVESSAGSSVKTSSVQPNLQSPRPYSLYAKPAYSPRTLPGECAKDVASLGRQLSLCESQLKLERLRTSQLEMELHQADLSKKSELARMESRLKSELMEKHRLQMQDYEKSLKTYYAQQARLGVLSSRSAGPDQRALDEFAALDGKWPVPI